jgi:hypothetical protein
MCELCGAQAAAAQRRVSAGRESSNTSKLLIYIKLKVVYFCSFLLLWRWLDVLVLLHYQQLLYFKSAVVEKSVAI